MTPAEKSGLCDGLFGRQCQTPPHFPDCEQYLASYMQGKEYRVKNQITLTFEKEKV